MTLITQKNPQTDPAILPDKSPRVLCTTPKQGYFDLQFGMFLL
jgi:hypothetical protein